MKISPDFTPNNSTPNTNCTKNGNAIVRNSVGASNTGPTVAQLVIAAQGGDQLAFGDLFERYRPVIVALAISRVRNVHEAEELTQDVFIQAMQKLDQLRVPEAFGGWLRQIVHRMAINRFSRQRSATACDPETLEATCIDDTTPENVAQDREQAAAVRNGIERLGILDRQTLRAFYLDGQSLIEMSDAFDAPVGTIKRRLHTARRRLAETLQDEMAEGDSADANPVESPAVLPMASARKRNDDSLGDSPLIAQAV
ncbi:sigma-70 family RNA polymerase sigma factor [Rhodopirellula sp. JC740]|uniref:Sigma-70 family RNA polymerase sigma factor n=2 Tax=Rhodopirellula halodulae TaxID=2894198 RepID=A0ABS8NK02_9BACT|nr:sigma-70 family RNA polymerase sigma factor [Rhodopirellula sp. JC740]MCC9657051.1 sigma-70 family RNA polymerase sigma factor [Rhodopirellula sp. JC737]